MTTNERIRLLRHRFSPNEVAALLDIDPADVVLADKAQNVTTGEASQNSRLSDLEGLTGASTLVSAVQDLQTRVGVLEDA